MNAPDDQEWLLVERARTQPEALRDLCHCYLPQVYGYAFYRIGQQQDVERLVADVFVQAASELKQFEYRGRGSVATWLFTIAYQHVQAFYRQHRPLVDQLQLQALLNLEHATPPADTQAASSAVLRQQISMLSPQQQEVLALKFFGRLPTSTIAAILDLDSISVAWLLCRSVEALRQLDHSSAMHAANGNP